jgi:SAM-dependent methyltransferase
VPDFVQTIGDGKCIVNIGAGYTSYPGTINVDFDPHKNVDIVGNAMDLPVRTESVDGVIMQGVLEHIRDPQTAIKEAYRVLKPTGCLHLEAPFIQGYHASPHDYQRFTISGLEVLARSFEIEGTGVVVGPASAFAWVSRDFLAVLFSFNSPTMFRVTKVLFRFLTFPLKYLDVFLAGNRYAESIASGFYLRAHKPANEQQENER